jgi:hypothetical protein
MHFLENLHQGALIRSVWNWLAATHTPLPVRVRLSARGGLPMGDIEL